MLSFSLKMNEEKSELLKYSWGPLYETLKEMHDKGDSHNDPLFNRAFELFSLLDNAKTIEEVRIIINEKCTFSPMEINRINSPCLDGIIATIKERDPLEELIRSYWKYMDTCRFYVQFKRKQDFVGSQIYPIFLASVTNRLEMLKLFVEIEGKERLINDAYNILYYACIYKLVDIVKFLIKNDATMTLREFGGLCVYSDLDIIELIYNPKYITLSTSALLYICMQKRFDIVRFLVGKGIQTTGLHTLARDIIGMGQNIDPEIVQFIEEISLQSNPIPQQTQLIR